MDNNPEMTESQFLNLIGATNTEETKAWARFVDCLDDVSFDEIVILKGEIEFVITTSDDEVSPRH